ncbi:hypothetical protein MO973_18300 [Paenibacillus sp. TRM 82003]|nr:hypothetical protein [Paenibacillus sp. TRM 82003]
MTELYYEIEPRAERTPERSAQSARSSRKWIARTIVVALWALLAGGAFALAYYYVGGIQSQLEQIQRTNEANTAELTRKLADIQGAMDANAAQAEALSALFVQVEQELAAVKEQMSLAGDSLSATAETRQALNERITDLSVGLEELRKSIKKLEEAARVY